MGIEIIENTAREDREELFEWWARLLVGSARGGAVDAYHIDLVRKLDPYSARVFLVIGGGHPDLPRNQKPAISIRKEFVDALIELCQIEIEQANAAIARLVAMGVIQHEFFSAVGGMALHPTAMGVRLLKLLYPDGMDVKGTFLERDEQASKTGETSEPV